MKVTIKALYSSIFQVYGGLILNFLIFLQGIILLPIYLSFITKESYGLWLYYLSLVAIGGILKSGIESNIRFNLASHIQIKQNFSKTFIWSCIFAQLLCAIIVSNIIAVLMKYDVSIPKIGYFIIFGTTFVMIFSSIFQGIIQSFHEAKTSFKFIIIGKFINILTTLILLVLDFGLASLFVGTFLDNFIVICLGLIFISSKHFYKIKIVSFKDLASVFCSSFPYMISSGSNEITNQVPLIFIKNVFGLEDLAIYGIIKKIMDFITGLITMIYSSSITFISANRNNDEYSNEKIIIKIYYTIITLGLIFGMLYTNHAELIIRAWLGIESSLINTQNIIIITAASITTMFVSAQRNTIFANGFVLSFVWAQTILVSISILFMLSIDNSFSIYVIPLIISISNILLLTFYFYSTIDTYCWLNLKLIFKYIVKPIFLVSFLMFLTNNLMSNFSYTLLNVIIDSLIILCVFVITFRRSIISIMSFKLKNE